MHPADILSRNYPPSILIYGMAGSGKTALLSQLSNAYIFDCDRGMKTAATLKDKFFNQRQKVTFDEYVDEDPKAPKAYMEIMQKLNEIMRLQLQGKWSHDAIGIDSLTGLVKAAMLQVLMSRFNNSMHDMDIKSWGFLVTAVERVLTLLRSFRIPVIVTAHVDLLSKPIEKKLEQEIIAMFPLSATNKHGMNKLMWLFDEVWHADKKAIGQNKQAYRVDGNKSGVYKTRTRSSFGLVRHDEIGMIELLKLVGFIYKGESK